MWADKIQGEQASKKMCRGIALLAVQKRPSIVGNIVAEKSFHANQ
jgi:hypothetical protein